MNQLEYAFQDVASPDRLILLAPDLVAVWSRRLTFRLTELGLHHSDEYAELGQASFVHYQHRVGRELRMLDDRHGWPIVPIDETDGVSDTATAVLDAMTTWGGGRVNG